MQQTLTGCAFCEASPGAAVGTARTWGHGEPVTHPICVDCATKTRPNPDECEHHACDGCGLVVDTRAALTRFTVTLGHLGGPIHRCARCSPNGPATYWTRDLEPHRVREGDPE